MKAAARTLHSLSQELLPLPCSCPFAKRIQRQELNVTSLKPHDISSDFEMLATNREHFLFFVNMSLGWT